MKHLSTFLKTYIDCEWPVFLGFNGNDSFEYDHHAVIAYGYNTLTATRDGEFANYFFVKVFDGYSTVPQYLSFNALQMYYLYDESDSNYLSTNMHAFCPYQ